MARAATTVEEIDRPTSSDETVSDPPIPSQPEKIDFFQQLSGYTPAEWQSLLAWVYRLAPITDRLATGNKAVYVQKYGGFFDEDSLKHDLGSGTYRIQLNQRGPNGKQKPIRQHVVEIEDLAFPPKVPEGEWVDDPRNKRWAWCRKKEDAATPSNGAQPANPWTPDNVLRMVKELRPEAPKEDHLTITKAVLDAVKETRAQMTEASDPMKMMGFITQIISLTRPAAAEKSSASEDPLLKLMFGQLEQARSDAADARKAAEAERQRNHELQLKMLEQKSSNTDPVALLKQMKELQTLAGGNEPDNRNWKEKLVDQGMEHVPEILSLAKTFVGRAGYARPAQPMQQPQSQPQGHTPAPAASQPSPAPTPTPTGEAMPPQPPVVTNIDPEIAWLSQVFESRGRDFVLAFAQDPDGGGDLADLISKYAGLAFYERIARMGKEKILEAIACLPQMKTDLAAAGSSEMLGKFIDDFIDPPEDDEDEDDEADDPLVPEGDAARARRKAKAVADGLDIERRAKAVVKS